MSPHDPGPVLLTDIERVLEEACGLTLSPGIRRTLGDAFQRAARELRLSPEAFLGRLRAREHRAVTALVEAAVVGETYFFRHPEQLAAVRQAAFDEAPRDRPLSVWSAGCATGEEPYTLAMGLLDGGRAGLGDRILATDVSSRALAVAAEARYGDWSLRRIEPELRARHFESSRPTWWCAPRPAPWWSCGATTWSAKRPRAPASTWWSAGTCSSTSTRRPPPWWWRSWPSPWRRAGCSCSGRSRRRWAPPRAWSAWSWTGWCSSGRRAGKRCPGARRAARSRRPPGRRPGAARPSPARSPSPALPRRRSRRPPRRRTRRRWWRRGRRRSAGTSPAAEQLARVAATRELCPEAWLLVSMVADARGDLAGAVDAVRRALYLDPGLALGHAALVPLYQRLGLHDDAARARRNALEALAGLDDAAPLRGVESITAGALRSALEGQVRSPRPPGLRTGSQP